MDLFLEDRPEFAAVGKAAIAAALIPFEDPDKLFPPNAPREHWYELLVNTLDKGPGSLPKNAVSIVTFNYDRSLEHYLYTVLTTRRRNDAAALEEMSSIPIIHVHGSLGGLSALTSDGRPYSPDLDPETVRHSASRIIVVGEASGDTPEFEEARRRLEHAERIVFLGFGFHEASVRRLGVFNKPWDDDRRSRVKVLGTSRGVPANQWLQIQRGTLNGAIPPRARRSTNSVFGFLNEDEPLDDPDDV